jgi:hypothetical protein
VAFGEQKASMRYQLHSNKIGGIDRETKLSTRAHVQSSLMLCFRRSTFL